MTPSLTDLIHHHRARLSKSVDRNSDLIIILAVAVGFTDLLIISGASRIINS
jgi:hypothetical protein